jgi:hypothetical protein
MDKVPKNYDLLLGQNLLDKFGLHLQIPSFDITLSGYSETLVRIPKRETGNQIGEVQELQGSVFCAFSVVECVYN